MQNQQDKIFDQIPADFEDYLGSDATLEQVESLYQALMNRDGMDIEEAKDEFHLPDFFNQMEKKLLQLDNYRRYKCETKLIERARKFIAGHYDAQTSVTRSKKMTWISISKETSKINDNVLMCGGWLSDLEVKLYNAGFDEVSLEELMKSYKKFSDDMSKLQKESDSKVKEFRAKLKKKLEKSKKLWS